MKLQNLTAAEIAEIRKQAYDDIESPCYSCPGREDHECRIYGETIVEDSPDVFIPCPDCEADALNDA